MRKALVVLAAVILLPAGAARADMVAVGDYVQMLSSPNRLAGFSGGEFTVNNSGEQFVSFCLEFNEHISIESYYWVGDIGESAVTGGTGTFDPLDPMTAYLYTQVRSGSYTPYFSNALGQAYAARALQTAIWHIEGEVILANPMANVYYADAVYALAGTSPYYTGAWSGLGDVRVLNLYTTRTEVATGEFSYSGFAQDQLTLVNVPEPGSLLLLGTGLLGLGLFVRRGRRK